MALRHVRLHSPALEKRKVRHEENRGETFRGKGCSPSCSSSRLLPSAPTPTSSPTKPGARPSRATILPAIVVKAKIATQSTFRFFLRTWCTAYEQLWMPAHPLGITFVVVLFHSILAPRSSPPQFHEPCENKYLKEFEMIMRTAGARSGVGGLCLPLRLSSRYKTCSITLQPHNDNKY